MKKIWVFILFIAFGCQQTTVNGQQTSCMDSIIQRAEYHLNIAYDLKHDQDDIVGACENFFSAIELIKLNVKKKHYDKKIFDMLYKSYGNLGRIFTDLTFPNTATEIYKEALKYAPSDSIRSIILKDIGFSYMFINNDSSFYYFDKCMETAPSNHLNEIDINKCIAILLYYDYDAKDSAYTIMRNNINKVEHEPVKESYCSLLGQMFFYDKQYDSAIYYLEKSVNSSLYFVRLGAADFLSCVYDSIGDEEKKLQYDKIVRDLSFDRINNEKTNADVIDLYNAHLKRIDDFYAKKKNRIYAIIISAIIIIISLIIYMALRNRRNSKKLIGIINDKNSVIDNMKDDILEKENTIRDVSFRNSLIEGKIKKKNSELEKRDNKIKELESELEKIENKLTEDYGVCDFQLYMQSDIVSKILNIVNGKQSKSFDGNYTRSLTNDELALLSQSANMHLNNMINRISVEFPKLKKEDLFYLCLVLLNLNDKQIATLFGVTYNTIWGRRNKICSILSINNAELNNYLSTKYL